jgi:hypothetical protein
LWPESTARQSGSQGRGCLPANGGRNGTGMGSARRKRPACSRRQKGHAEQGAYEQRWRNGTGLMDPRRGDIKDTNCWLEGWGHWRDADPRILDVCEGRLSIGSGRRALPLPGVRHGVGRGGRDVPRPQRCSWVEATAGLRGRRDGVGGERRKEGPQRGDDTQ